MDNPKPTEDPVILEFKKYGPRYGSKPEVSVLANSPVGTKKRPAKSKNATMPKITSDGKSHNHC